MSQINETTLDGIVFENVSCRLEGRDPILESVDFEFPLDQTVIVKSTLPDQAVLLLEILAGRRVPEGGRVLFNGIDQSYETNKIGYLISSAFEKDRPNLKNSVLNYLQSRNVLKAQIQEAIDFFDLNEKLNEPIYNLQYSEQKLIQLIFATLNLPQLLILEDPASGLTETQFLNFLDWVNYGQRKGAFRHLFMTNHHPTALRHMAVSFLHIEDGLIYFDELEPSKKAVHF